MTKTMEIALAITAPRRLAALKSFATLDRAALLAFLDDPQLAELLPHGAVATHLYFGSEYCEHLFPNDADLTTALDQAERLGLNFVLPTPIANDGLLARIVATVDRLPVGAEVLANDWGVAQVMKTQFPRRGVVAGRQLAKMIKDPRVPAPTWSKVYPSNYRAAPYARLLSSFGIRQVELDIPPFATPDAFTVNDLDVAVWAPYAYIAKGRICKIGSLGQKTEDKFAPGRACHRECLGILEREPDAVVSGLRTYSRGTTMFYQHDAAMFGALRGAIAQGHVKRLVLSEV
ncbi:hypothetical protein [Herminiimonas sp. CN]|uniref:hypothetical protein n=1 Tax=Herminiimonas sp. CN TaxID=1349818 RepID=UPI0012DF056A|nr:hypothetical protein [Herminiimonas sp. CN]